MKTKKWDKIWTLENSIGHFLSVLTDNLTLGLSNITNSYIWPISIRPLYEDNHFLDQLMVENSNLASVNLYIIVKTNYWLEIWILETFFMFVVLHISWNSQIVILHRQTKDWQVDSYIPLNFIVEVLQDMLHVV